MTQVFVDTSALLTLLDSDDPRHEDARAAFSSLANDELVTHGYVIAESIAVARRRFGVEGVVTLLDDFMPVIDAIPVDLTLHAAAQAAYRASLPSSISFVDRVSLAVMDRDNLTTAFAFDPDLVVPGGMVLPQVAPGLGSAAGTTPS